MNHREKLIYQEASALYEEVFGEPPPRRVADGSVILDMVTRNLPATAYNRLRSPFLRPSTITGPKPPGGMDS